MGLAIRHRSKESRVPTDSLSDIAFLLIIFFILTTSIRRLAGFTTELPAGQRDQTQTSDKTPTVALHDGAITFNDEPITLPELRRRLKDLGLDTKSGTDRIVLVEATGSVNYQQYYDIMAGVTAAGGVIGIITEEKVGSP